MNKLIVFSDLDGTLLNHETYDYTPALETLSTLQSKNIPVILASSKTAAEILDIRDALKLSTYPAIVENGAGVLEPSNEKNKTDDTHVYQELINKINQLPNHLRQQFQGFNDWSIDEVVHHTGLSAQNAALAKQRAFSEPGLWFGSKSDFEDFEKRLKDKGLAVTQGGRFISISKGHTKAHMMHVILHQFKQQSKDAETGKILSIALGDAPNDIEMLEAADIGVVVFNPSRPVLSPLRNEKNGQVIRTTLPGPEGWAEAMQSILRKYA